MEVRVPGHPSFKLTKTFTLNQEQAERLSPRTEIDERPTRLRRTRPGSFGIRCCWKTYPGGRFSRLLEVSRGRDGSSCSKIAVATGKAG